MPDPPIRKVSSIPKTSPGVARAPAVPAAAPSRTSCARSLKAKPKGDGNAESKVDIRTPSSKKVSPKKAQGAESLFSAPPADDLFSSPLSAATQAAAQESPQGTGLFFAPVHGDVVSAQVEAHFPYWPAVVFAADRLPEGHKISHHSKKVPVYLYGRNDFDLVPPAGLRDFTACPELAEQAVSEEASGLFAKALELATPDSSLPPESRLACYYHAHSDSDSDSKGDKDSVERLLGSRAPSKQEVSTTTKGMIPSALPSPIPGQATWRVSPAPSPSRGGAFFPEDAPTPPSALIAAEVLLEDVSFDVPVPKAEVVHLVSIKEEEELCSPCEMLLPSVLTAHCPPTTANGQPLPLTEIVADDDGAMPVTEAVLAVTPPPDVDADGAPAPSAFTAAVDAVDLPRPFSMPAGCAVDSFSAPPVLEEVPADAVPVETSAGQFDARPLDTPIPAHTCALEVTQDLPRPTSKRIMPTNVSLFPSSSENANKTSAPRKATNLFNATPPVTPPLTSTASQVFDFPTAVPAVTRKVKVAYSAGDVFGAPVSSSSASPFMQPTDVPSPVLDQRQFKAVVLNSLSLQVLRIAGPSSPSKSARSTKFSHSHTQILTVLLLLLVYTTTALVSRYEGVSMTRTVRAGRRLLGGAAACLEVPAVVRLQEGLIEMTRKQPVSAIFTYQVDTDADARQLVQRTMGWHGMDELSFPLLDINMPTTMNEVYSSLRAGKGDKGKPVLGTVSGMGSGKTRLLEEVAIGILKDNSHKDKFNIVLPITYNSIWRITQVEVDNAFKYCSDEEEVAIFTFCTRILSMVFNIQLSKVIKEVKKLSFEADSTMLEIVLNHVVTAIKEANQQRVPDGIVFLVDESVQMAKRVKKDDPCGPIREFILGSPALGDLNLRTTLFMTSLEQALLGATTSNRPIVVIPLAGKLNVEKIVDEVWAPRVAANGGCVTENSRDDLIAWAVAMCAIPRQVVIFGQRLSSVVADISAASGGATVNVTNPIIAHSLVDTEKELQSIYQQEWAIPAQELTALIFNEAIDIKTASARALLTTSVFTNKIARLSIDDKPQTILPEASPMMLALAAKSAPKLYRYADSYDNRLERWEKAMSHRDVPFLLLECCQLLPDYVNATTANKFQSIGALLEDFTKLWMEVRVRQGSERQGPFFLEHLLPGILPLKISQVEMAKSTNYSMFEFAGKNSRDDTEHMVQLLSATTVSEGQPVAIVYPAQGEAWDMMLVVYRPGDSPLVIVMETKSRQRVSALDTDNEQAKHFFTITQPACRMAACPSNSAAMAIKKGDVVFVYFDNQNVQPLKNWAARDLFKPLEGQDEPQGVVVRTSNTEVDNYLSFFAASVDAARNLMRSSNVKKQAEKPSTKKPAAGATATPKTSQKPSAGARKSLKATMMRTAMRKKGKGKE